MHFHGAFSKIIMVKSLHLQTQYQDSSPSLSPESLRDGVEMLQVDNHIEGTSNQY